MSKAMTSAFRAESLAAMSDDRGLDILVIGGGITGVGAALDAATRGLRVGIVEAADWSEGTSSRSSNSSVILSMRLYDFARLGTKTPLY